MPDPQNNFLKYSGLGLQLLLVIGTCAWVGLKIDQYLGFKFPVFLMSLMLLSFIGMMYKLYRSLNE
jgi:ATP synthase protein I